MIDPKKKSHEKGTVAKLISVFLFKKIAKQKFN